MVSRILPFLALFIESYADCEEGGTCHATSNVLLQRKREELSQQMVYESTYDGGDSGPMLMDGHFTLSYDPSVYCCDEATIKDMQQKGFVSFQEGLAELLGFGLTSADLVDLQFVPNPANHSEVDVKFLFKCPAALSAAEMQAEMQKITTLRLLGTLKAKMSDHGLNPAAFHMGILPVTASYKPLPHSTSSPTTSWSYTTTIGGVVVEVTGRFTVSYDPGLYTGNATEVAALQEKSQTAFKTAIAAALGAPIRASDLTLRWERISPALLQTRQTQGTLSEAICFFTIHSRTETASDLEQKVNGMDQTALEQSVLSEMTAHGVPTAHMAVVSPITVELNTGTIPGTTTGSSWVVSTTPLSTTPFSTTPFSTTFSTTTTSSFRMEDVHPCASFEDFTPEKRTSDYGWCEGDNFIVDNQTETACINAGCMSYAPYCWCDDEAKCQSLGMPWKYHTCEMEVSMYMHGEYAALISAAHERKSCAGLETSWHQNIAEVIEWSARMCCKSWPKKLCDPTAVMVTPCKDPSDFMPDTPYDPSYPGQSCSDTMRSWYSEYTAMENATKAGSCAGISLSWGEELTRWVTYPAKQCCNSSPATLCQPHLRKVSFCAAESDFHPELNVHEWCEHSNGIPDEASCAAAGCIAHRGTHCECRSASSCQASSGAWRTQTCAENAQWMHDDPVMLEALMAAENGTDCADISVHGRTLMDYISYSVQKCCSSFPASICHKNAQKMSQCKSLSSFLPAALVWSHCWGTDSVSEDACMTPGLRCSWSGSHCHCDDRSSCEAVNGTWEEFTCAQEVDTWDMTIHLTVQEALDTDDCELQAYGRKVSQVIATASSCCSDWPASVCAKTAELVTPCKTSADYLPSHALHSWCDMYGRNPADCHAHGCTPTHSSCHCETQETCEAAGAIWRSNSCADEVKWQSPGWHEAMKIARDTDSCDGDLNGLTVKDATDHFARHCCASYPATLCDKDARKMTPCKDEQDFLKDKELPGGFCDFRSVPPATDVCTAHQCTESGGGCHCHERAPCEALGGTWKPYTCSDEVAAWGSEAMKALQDADEGKAQCPDLTMLGQAVQDAIAYTAQKCCASFPATVCDKTAKKMTPCQHTSDFLPDQVIWAYCHVDYQFTPNATVCNAQTDCQGDEHWCHCWSETGCAAVGGTWMEQTCRKEIDDYWRPEQHKVLQWAEGNGTCVDQVIDGWVRAEDQVWLASTCCSNFPSTLCDHDVEPMTPCKRHEDFLATKVRYSWCNVYPSPEESACIASGCKYEHSWCQCETEASCATAGGQFHSTNCTSEIQWWQADTHKAIKEAIDQGSCTGVETRWSPVENSVSWLGECCSSGMDVCQELASG